MSVAIIVPTYNAPEMLRACITAVRANTQVPYELVISDDNSPDPDMQQLLQEYAQNGVRIIYNKGKRGFPSNVNQAVAQTESKYICLLNSDTRVCVWWLIALLDEMDDPSVGIVGAKLIYPNGSEHANTIQHCGVARDARGPFHIYRFSQRDRPEVNVRREINCVTFACALIRRSLWDELGGLDEHFEGGQFEDVDFCYWARDLGWKVVYTPRCQVYHHEHGSGLEFVNATTGANRKRLAELWPNMPSDVHLFLDIDNTIEGLAAFVHSVRASAMAYTYQYPDRNHFAHCERLAQMCYSDLPEVEKDWAREYARQLKDILA